MGMASTEKSVNVSTSPTGEYYGAVRNGDVGSGTDGVTVTNGHGNTGGANGATMGAGGRGCGAANVERRTSETRVCCASCAQGGGNAHE